MNSPVDKTTSIAPKKLIVILLSELCIHQLEVAIAQKVAGRLHGKRLDLLRTANVSYPRLEF